MSIISWRARMAGRPTGNADARAVIERIVSVLNRTPKGELLHCDLGDTGAMRVRIDAEDLAEVLGNVLENATRYAREAITIRTASRGAQAMIGIMDDGPGIPHVNIEYILDRGRRLDESSGGAGLGLSIANDIVVAAGGLLSIENGDPGVKVMIQLAVGKP